MTWLLPLTLVLVPVLWPLSGHALTCRFVIEPPPTWHDGRPVPLEEIAGYTLYEAPCRDCFSDEPTVEFVIDEVGDPEQPVLLVGDCPRRRWWQVRAVDQQGQEGLPSPPLFLKR